jgi:anti-anti-sigma factor
MLEQELRYTTQDGAKDGVTILILEGPLTLANMFKLQSDLRTMKPPCLIMDLTLVPYMDSAGLGVIMNVFVSAENGGRKLILAGVNDRLLSLLEMTRVDTVLDIRDSVEAAEAAA